MAAGRRTDEQARATRAAILERAVEVASWQGFEGFTIGGLARDLEMSKAGILGHFHTKEQLQIEARGEAVATFVRVVSEPARAESRPGLDRLRAYCRRWVDFIDHPPWTGGCVITAASFEFDDRDGPLADTMREGHHRWRDAIALQAQIAIDAGDLPPEPDAEQLAYLIVALSAGTIQARQMHRDPQAAERLRTAYASLLGGTLAAAAQ